MPVVAFCCRDIVSADVVIMLFQCLYFVLEGFCDVTLLIGVFLVLTTVSRFSEMSPSVNCCFTNLS